MKAQNFLFFFAFNLKTVKKLAGNFVLMNANHYTFQFLAQIFGGDIFGRHFMKSRNTIFGRHF